jgi:hypothetical protein
MVIVADVPAVAAGEGFTVITVVVVLLPFEFDTTRVTVSVPAPLKQTVPGFCCVEDGGVPPWNVHDQAVGEPVLASEKLMQFPSQTEVDEELITGFGAAQLFTVTVTDELEEHPLASVTKTV